MEELKKVACEIDTIIDKINGAFPSEEIVISLFVAVVAGFEELEKKADKIAEENDISKDEVKKTIKEQKDAFIQSMKTSGKQFIKSKRDELKAMVAQMKSEAAEIPKSLVKAVADAAMPTMISPGAPNPASSALRLYLSLVAIRAMVLSVLMLTSKILNLILELGLGSTPFATMITSVTKPILDLKKKLDDEMNKADKAECEGSKPEDYKVKDPDGKEITGLDIQAKLKSWLDIQTFPLSKSSKRKIKKKVKNADDESDDPIWGDIVLGYSDFYDKAIAK
jgi:hypothetical protein